MLNTNLWWANAEQGANSDDVDHESHMKSFINTTKASNPTDTVDELKRVRNRKLKNVAEKTLHAWETLLREKYCNMLIQIGFQVVDRGTEIGHTRCWATWVHKASRDILNNTNGVEVASLLVNLIEAFENDVKSMRGVADAIGYTVAIVDGKTSW